MCCRRSSISISYLSLPPGDATFVFLRMSVLEGSSLSGVFAARRIITDTNRAVHIFARDRLSATPSENISKRGPQNRRSLGFARDDKGNGRASKDSGCRSEGAYAAV